MYDNQPLAVGTGTTLAMVWHIAIQHMDPKLVKALKPGAIGLTSRWTDRDTGEATLLGNTRMNGAQRAALIKMRQGEAKVREMDRRQVKKGEILARGKTKKVSGK